MSTVDDEEEITQYACGLCTLPIAEPDPFEFVIDARPVHGECYDRYIAGRPTAAAVEVCDDVHEQHGRCVMFAGHQGRHRTRSPDGRLLRAWWGPKRGAPF